MKKKINYLMNYSPRSRPLSHGSATCGARSRLKGSVWDELTCVPQSLPLHFSVVTPRWILGLEWPAGITQGVWAAGKHLRHFAPNEPEKAECVRSLVLKCAFKTKGFITATITETTADGNNFLESRGLHESWDLKGQNKLQNRST